MVYFMVSLLLKKMFKAPSLSSMQVLQQTFETYFRPPRLTGATFYHDSLRNVLLQLLQDLDLQTTIHLWTKIVLHNIFLSQLGNSWTTYFHNNALDEVHKQHSLLLPPIQTPSILYLWGHLKSSVMLQKSVTFGTCNNKNRMDLIWFVRHLEFCS